MTRSLHDLQQHFSKTLFEPGLADHELDLNAPGGNLDRRLDIYRNNIFHSLTTALADLYPVVERLVGKDFFRGTARAYLLADPPKQAAMVFFGAGFPAFLSSFEHTHKHPWLADVARLELAWHRAYHATDATPLDAGSLAGIPPDILADSVFPLHPSVQLVASPYPVLQIWQANQAGADEVDTVDLDSGTERVCLYRPHYQVMLKSMNTGQYTFIKGLQHGLTLAEAITRAGESEPGFQADQCLADCLINGLLDNRRLEE